MITAEKAAAICQCSRRLIYRRIDEGSLHFRELPDGLAGRQIGTIGRRDRFSVALSNLCRRPY
jgi:hypothetical protein